MAAGEEQLHVGGAEAPAGEEGGAGRAALPDGEHSVGGAGHIQVVHVAVDDDPGVGGLADVDGYVPGHRLHIQPPQVLQGADGIGTVVIVCHGCTLPGKLGTGARLALSLILAPLGEKAAPGLVVAEAVDHVLFLLGAPAGKEAALIAVQLGLELPAVGAGGGRSVLRRGGVRGCAGVLRRAGGGLVGPGVEVEAHIAVLVLPGGAALDGLLGLEQRVLGLVHGDAAYLGHVGENGVQVAGPAAGLTLGAALGPTGTRAQVAEQLVHVAQVVHGPAEGVLVAHASGGHVQKAVVQVVGQLLHHLVLCGGGRGGGQLGGHRVDKSALDLFHCVQTSSAEVSASSRARVFSHSWRACAQRSRPASVMA